MNARWFRKRRQVPGNTAYAGNAEWLRTAHRTALQVMDAPTPFDVPHRWYTGTDDIVHLIKACRRLTARSTTSSASIAEILDERICFSCFSAMIATHLGDLPSVLHTVARAQTLLDDPLTEPVTLPIVQLATAAQYLQRSLYALELLDRSDVPIDLRRGTPSLLDRYAAHTRAVTAAAQLRRWDSLQLIRDWAENHPDGPQTVWLERLDDPTGLEVVGVAVNERGLDPFHQHLVECWVRHRRYNDSLALLAAPRVVATWLSEAAPLLYNGEPLYPRLSVITTFDVDWFDTDGGAVIETALTLWDPFTDGAYRSFVDALTAAAALR